LGKTPDRKPTQTHGERRGVSGRAEPPSGDMTGTLQKMTAKGALENLPKKKPEKAWHGRGAKKVH